MSLLPRVQPDQTRRTRAIRFGVPFTLAIGRIGPHDVGFARYEVELFT